MCCWAMRLVVLFLSILSANALSENKYVIFSVINNGTGFTVVPGTVTKHPKCSPCWKQTKLWEPRLDNGYPNVVYDPDDTINGAYRVWYGGCVKGCGAQMLMYANSSDGFSWLKPNLGLFDLAKFDDKLFGKVGTNNNVVIYGGGIGIYKDEHETDPSKRFKASGGVMCPVDGGCPTGHCPGCIAGTGTSPDGFRWTDPVAVQWPRPQRYDCHTDMFYDRREGKYVITTRDYTGTSGRDIAISRSRDTTCGNWESPTHLVEEGDEAHQLYSQITFPFGNIYLGIVMIFDAQTGSKGPKAGHVHCRLSWAPETTGPWEWVDKKVPLPGTEFIPAGAIGSFDSHICFAAHSPIQTQEGVRIYYMGGDGPHNGARNSSFAMAMLRTDGFVGVKATDEAHFTTAPLNVTGAQLVVSLDIPENVDGGLVSIGAVGVPGLGIEDAVPLSATGTDTKVAFTSGHDFSALIGRTVQLQINARHATLYTAASL